MPSGSEVKVPILRVLACLYASRKVVFVFVKIEGTVASSSMYILTGETTSRAKYKGLDSDRLVGSEVKPDGRDVAVTPINPSFEIVIRT